MLGLLAELWCESDERVDVHLFLHHSVGLHEFFDLLTFERRYNGSLLLLDKYSIESILVANSIEDVQLGQTKAVSLAIFELLKEFGLCLVVKVGVLDVFGVLEPYS